MCVWGGMHTPLLAVHRIHRCNIGRSLGHERALPKAIASSENRQRDDFAFGRRHLVGSGGLGTRIALLHTCKTVLEKEHAVRAVAEPDYKIPREEHTGPAQAIAGCLGHGLIN